MNFIANFIVSFDDKWHSKTAPKDPLPSILPMVKSDSFNVLIDKKPKNKEIFITYKL